MWIIMGAIDTFFSTNASIVSFALPYSIQKKKNELTT